MQHKEVEVEVSTEDHTYTVKATITFKFEDHGIGPYEYWGARGNDVDIRAEVDEIDITEVVDEEGNELSGAEIDNIKKLLLPAIEEKGDRIAADLEPEPEDDYEPDRDDSDF